jgi:hypothetical protein
VVDIWKISPKQRDAYDVQRPPAIKFLSPLPFHPFRKKERMAFATAAMG